MSILTFLFYILVTPLSREREKKRRRKVELKIQTEVLCFFSMNPDKSLLFFLADLLILASAGSKSTMAKSLTM